jgi:hypothetical protein
VDRYRLRDRTRTKLPHSQSVGFRSIDSSESSRADADGTEKRECDQTNAAANAQPAHINRLLAWRSGEPEPLDAFCMEDDTPPRPDIS